MTIVQPQTYVDIHPSQGHPYSVLEFTETIVTTRDINELVRVDQTNGNEDNSRILGRNYSSSTKLITPGSYVASPRFKSNLEMHSLLKTKIYILFLYRNKVFIFGSLIFSLYTFSSVYSLVLEGSYIMCLQ